MSTFQELMKKDVRLLSVRGEMTLPSGKIIPLEKSDILSFSISEGVSDGVLLGACPSASLKLNIADPRGEFLYLGEKRGAASAAGAQIVLFLMAMEEDGTWQESMLGRFFVTEMTGREHQVVCMVNAVDALGYLFDGAFEDTLVYPSTLGDIAQVIARQSGMEVNTDFPGYDSIIGEKPDFSGMTCRGALGCVCAAAGCFAHVERNGYLRIKPVRDTHLPYEINADNTILRQYGEVSFGPLNALRIEKFAPPRNADRNIILTDDVGVREDTLYTIAGNPLFPFGADWADQLGRKALDNLKGLTLVRSLLHWQGDPTLMIGRSLQLCDSRGRVTLTSATRQVLTFDRGFTMHTDCTVRTPFAAGAGVIISPSGRLQGSQITGNIDGGLIRDGSLGVTALSAHSITGHYIAANAIDAEHLTAGAVTADKIESKTITADKLQTGLITAESGLIGEGAIGSAQIADGSITDAKIVELTANKINAGTLSVERLVVVGNEKSIVYTINEANGTPQLSQTTLDGGSLTQRSITADRIVAEAITSDEIAANAVTANKILSGAVTTEKLDALSVTADKLAAESVTASKIAADVGRTLDLSSNESVKASVVAGVENSAMTLTKDEFTLAFDGKHVMEVDEDSAVFDVDTLTATGQIIGNVVNTQAATTITVPSGASIQSAIDNLGKYLLGNVTIYVNGQHTENLMIQGFSGPGIFILRFNSGAVLSGSIEIFGCSSVQIHGPSQTECCILSSADNCINVRSVPYFSMYRVYMMGTGAGFGVMADFCMAHLAECNFAGFACGVEGRYNAQIGLYNCIGGGDGDKALSTYAAWAHAGSMVSVYGDTRPVGALYDSSGWGLMRDAGAAPTPASGAEPTVQTTYTLKPSGSRGAVYATRDGSGNYVHAWGYYTNPYQGKNSGAGGYMFGIWLFDGMNDLQSALQGKTIESATLTLKRVNAYGVDGKKARIYSHGLDSVAITDNPNEIFTDTGLEVTLDRGKSASVTLPESVLEGIKNGTVRGFGLSSQKYDDLMQLDGTVCDINIVYT